MNHNKKFNKPSILPKREKEYSGIIQEFRPESKIRNRMEQKMRQVISWCEKSGLNREEFDEKYGYSNVFRRMVEKHHGINISMESEVNELFERVKKDFK
jgi:hypothetical protein